MTFYKALEKNDPVEEAIPVEVCHYLPLCSTNLDFNSLTHLETTLMTTIFDKQSIIIFLYI
jgi:hypothetical protein